jgi:hypothetical protein
MSAKDAAALTIGGEPRIDFLPPEVKQRKQARKTRRSLVALVIVVIVACAGGYVFATSLAVQSQIALANEQATTQSLLQQQTEFAEVRSVTGELQAVSDARRAGSATEVMWAPFLAKLQAALPAGSVIETYLVDSQTALESAPVTAVPLQNPRIATITFTASVPSLASADALLVNLRELPGYADAAMTTASLDEGLYRVSVTLNINADALEKRFFESAGDDVEAADNDANDADAVEGGE